jgi:long-chain fatty acid transport protein
MLRNALLFGRRALAPALVACLLIADLPVASAGGLQLSTRGVRPTARAGAFVAGADDLGALWFNPAGLAVAAGGESKRDFLIDFGYVAQSTEYTRIDSGNNVQETVTNEAPGLPVPTFGIGFDVGDKLVVAGGVYAPYAALGKYPEDGAQRYSLVDMSQSLLVILEAAVAYKVNDKIRVGVGLQNMIFKMSSRIVFSGCPGETACAPEDPEFDSLGQVDQTTYFSPSAVVGAQIDVSPKITIGAAFQLPFKISGQGSFASRLPSSGFFDGAEIVGDRADVTFTLPAMVRGGIELRPTPKWRVELAADMEFWSQHEQFSIEPQNVRIEGAPGVGTYEIGPLVIPRHFENSVAVMAGVEGAVTPDLTVLGGYSFETAASPDEYLSVITVDGQKHLIAGGIGYRRGKLTFNATLGFVSVASRTVDPDTGMVLQLTPIRDTSDDPLEVNINWGDYSASWLIAGAGVTGAF